MEMKITLLIRKYGTPCMWAAGVCSLAGILAHDLWNLTILADICFLLGLLLAGFPVFFRAWQGLKFKTIGIECLVSIAVIGACIIGEFSEAAIVTFLFQFGSYLEQKTMKKTRSAIKELVAMAPSTAWRIDGDDPEEIDIDEVEEGDTLLVKTGNQIPVDGFVTAGDGYVNEASISGESRPVHKHQGDSLYAGTILDSGTLQMEATKVGEDTTFAKIIALVEEAQDAKSPAERFIDRFAKYYTPAVVVMAAVVLLFTRNLDTAITVLVLACPGALVIGAPIANVAGIGKGAKNGILLKGGDSLHTFVKTDTFVFDKTGTLTYGRPRVVEVFCEEENGRKAMTGLSKSEVTSDDKNPSTDAPNIHHLSRKEILSLAASAETASDHPLAQAIKEYAKESNLSIKNTVSTEIIKGSGLIATIDDSKVLVGNLRLMEQEGVILPQIFNDRIQQMQNQGQTTVLVSINGKTEMILGISDALREDARSSMTELKKLGIRNLVMLTGDNEKTAQSVAENLGLNSWHGELLPQDKLTILQTMQKEGKIVTFAGDGVNDSPALTAADTGIAMGSGTDVAIESSDIVLLKSDLSGMVTALKIAKKTVAIMYQNIFIAVGTVILLLIGLFMGYIHMSIGMLIHEASILVVIFNAMRLLL